MNSGAMLACEASPALHQPTVIDRREAAPGIVVLGLHAPELAKSARPGHFVMIVPPHGERAATALGIYEVRDERISVMAVVVGSRTRELAEVSVGTVLTCLGPLGNGFDVPALGADAAIVAGGVGIASVLLLAQALRAANVATTLYYGARTAAALVDAQTFADVGVRVELATDDGTRGHHGYVTDLLARTQTQHSAVAACGPTPMLRATAAVARARGLVAQLSLEEAFACGVGACWGCVVPLDRASAQAPRFPAPAEGEPREYVHARICKEGPVFLAHELRW